MRQLDLVLMAAVLGLAGCSPRAAPPGEALASPPPKGIALPTPRMTGEMSLEEALLKRRSVRAFTSQPLTLEEISQLLWAAQGITSDWGGRTAPSAGALYPLELYVATPDGFTHYVPQGHRLEVRSGEDLRARLWAVSLMQSAVQEAPAVIVVTAVHARTEAKYGAQRSPRYVHLEAGHAAQNILLQAVALNLGAVPIGAFLDDQVQAVLSLPSDHRPLYLIPVGHPKE